MNEIKELLILSGLEPDSDNLILESQIYEPNLLGIDVSKFKPEIDELDSEMNNLEKIYGFDITKSSHDLASELYDKFLREQYEDEQWDYQNNINSRREYFENMYGDIESAIEDLADGEEITEEEFLNGIGLEYFDDYADNEMQSEYENRVFRRDLSDKIERYIWEQRDLFMDSRIDLLERIFNQNGFSLHIEESNQSDSTYFELWKDVEDEEGYTESFYGAKIRWSDHEDHYGSEYHMWFNDTMSEMIELMISVWGKEYKEWLEWLKTRK